jgi:hypothetical protein
MQFAGRQNMAGEAARSTRVDGRRRHSTTGNALLQSRKKCDTMSSGTGKMMVEFFSAEIVFNVCR